MIVSIKTLKKMYPQPVTFLASQRSQEYCVGGALCKYVELVQDTPIIRKDLIDNRPWFPTDIDLGEAIRIVNTDISEREAQDAALCVIVQNDKGDFDKAWELLEEALNPEMA